MKSIIYIIVFFISPLYLWAGGLQINLQSQRQMGMGHTGTGLALDASSLFFNPGSMGFIRNGGVQFGSSIVLPATIFLEAPPSIYLQEMERFTTTPIYLYAAFKGKKDSKLNRFAFGIGLNNPFGGTAKWPEDWKGKFISQEFSFNTFFLQPTLSFNISPQVGIGAGMTLGFASLLSRKAISGTDGPNSTEGSAQFSGFSQVAGYNVGIYLKPNDILTLGISYRSRIGVNINDGLVQFNVPVSLEENYPDLSFTSNITLPHVLNIGIGYKAEERMTLALDFNFTGWNVYDSLNLVLSEKVDNLRNYPTRKYENTLSFRVGGEYVLNEFINLRAGGFYDNSPVADHYMTPEFPDANKLGVSAGIGISIKQKLAIDISYIYEFTGERTAFYDEGKFDGTYESASSIFGLGLGYRF